MKRLLTNLAVMVSVAGTLLAISSCKEEDPAAPATVSIQVTATTPASISFTLSPENAVSVSYSVAKADAADYAFESMETKGDSDISIEETGLEENTNYIIRAYATNADGVKSEVQQKEAVTSSEASVSIDVIELKSTEITFKITPVNAVSYAYAVVESTEDVENVELKNKIDGGEAREFTETGLKENTAYSIIAAATNAAGDVSERAYESARTEIEPKVTIGEITPQSNQANVVLSFENAAKYAWSYAKKGEPQPEKDTFKEVALSGNSATLLVSGLEPSTQYTVYAYAINTKAYAGEIESKDFETIEYVQKPFEITVSNITSTDADISVTMDKEIYSKFYFVLGSNTTIMDIDSWDWASKIQTGWSWPMYFAYTDNMECNLRTWGDSDYGLTLEGTYMIGGIPEKIDGTLDNEAAIWTSATLKPVVIGESPLTCTINEVSTAMSTLTYNVTVSDENNLDCFYVYSTQGDISQNQTELDNAILSTIQRWPAYKPGKDSTLTWLSASTTYTLIAVAKDNDGKLSDASILTVTTKSLDFEGDAICSAEVSQAEKHDVTFDVTLNPGTVKVLYHSATKTDYDNDPDSFLRSLKVNNRKEITSSGDFSISGLDAGTGYVFGFVPVDEKGLPGKTVIIEQATDEYVFDGNPDATVALEINCGPNEYGGWSAVIKATPSEQVSKYFYQLKYENYNTNLTDNVFAGRCMTGQYTEYTGPQTFAGWGGNGEMVEKNASILILAIDQEGKLAPVVETRIEETWN